MSENSNTNVAPSRHAYEGRHILTNDYEAETDTWKTGVNNNVLVLGPSGSGKTRHYVKPNLLQSHESMVISDTKGSLYGEVGPSLKKRGYHVMNLDFTDLINGIGYNPLDYIRYDKKIGKYKEEDILTICKCIIPDREIGAHDPFWGLAARQYLACLISYVLEALPEEEHDFSSVGPLISIMSTKKFIAMMEELDTMVPESIAVTRYLTFKDNAIAEKMDGSIRGILSTHLDPLIFDEAVTMYKKPGRIDFSSLGKRKTALFLTISDTDRAMDKLADIFMTQALHILCMTADKEGKWHRLPVPVRFYLDDFATNLFIPDFDKIISIIRSREISVSVILQSVTQLESLYGPACARTIINNCDRQLYLGGQDIDTATYISKRVNKTLDSILNLPIEKAYYLERGKKPLLSEKYEYEDVPMK